MCVSPELINRIAVLLGALLISKYFFIKNSRLCPCCWFLRAVRICFARLSASSLSALPWLFPGFWFAPPFVSADAVIFELGSGLVSLVDVPPNELFCKELA